MGRFDALSRFPFASAAFALPVILAAGLAGCASLPKDAPVALHEARAELDRADDLETDDLFPKTVATSKDEFSAAVKAFKDVPADQRKAMNWADSAAVAKATTVRDRVGKANTIRLDMQALDGNLDNLGSDVSLASLSQQVRDLKAKLVAMEKAGTTKQGFALLSEIPLHGPTVFFDTEKTTISRRDKPALQELARTIAGNDQLKLKVVGYADPRGKGVLNDALAKRRAQSVRDYLVASGLKSSQIDTLGMGSRAAYHKSGLPKLQLERRVEVIVTTR